MTETMPKLERDEIERYARHLVLPEIGGPGQQRLRAAKVLVVGAGGLGAPLLQYLAAAGVGRLGIVDDDRVSRSNLNRQVIHGEADIGRAKVDSAAEAIARLNPSVTVEAHGVRLTADNAAELIAGYDLVADGSDNFATRYLLNDACIAAGKTLVAAALLRFEGQIGTYKAHLGAPHPCYRCLFPEAPAPGTTPSCAEAGILGAVAGVLGTLQAVEVVKELLDLGDGLSGRFLIYDALTAKLTELRARRDPNCPACGADQAAGASKA